MNPTFLLIAAAIVIIGIAVGYWLHAIISNKRLDNAKDLAERIKDEARKEAQAQKKEIILQGQDELYRQKREREQELK